MCVAREASAEWGGMGKRGCARRLGEWVWVCMCVNNDRAVHRYTGSEVD